MTRSNSGFSRLHLGSQHCRARHCSLRLTFGRRVAQPTRWQSLQTWRKLLFDKCCTCKSPRKSSPARSSYRNYCPRCSIACPTYAKPATKFDPAPILTGQRSRQRGCCCTRCGSRRIFAVLTLLQPLAVDPHTSCAPPNTSRVPPSLVPLHSSAYLSSTSAVLGLDAIPAATSPRPQIPLITSAVPAEDTTPDRLGTNDIRHYPLSRISLGYWSLDGLTAVTGPGRCWWRCNTIQYGLGAAVCVGDRRYWARSTRCRISLERR